MANTYRTASGKVVDMDLLRAKNQNVRAVGNMNVDAEGNTLDSAGNIIEEASKRVNRVYHQQVQNVGALRRSIEPTPIVEPVAPPQFQDHDVAPPVQVVPPPPTPVQPPPKVVAPSPEPEEDDDRFVAEWDEEVPEKPAPPSPKKK